MCYGCWAEAGKPTIDTPAVRAAAASIPDVYEYSCAGGNLHIVVDDWNLEDSHLAFCAKRIAEGGYRSPYLEGVDSSAQLAAEQHCHDLLAALTLEERASALALSEKFWGRDI